MTKIDIPVYCINLERCQERKEIMTEEFKKNNIDYTFIDAIDATKMDDSIRFIDDEFRKKNVYAGKLQDIHYLIDLFSFPSEYILNTSNGEKLTIDYAIATVFSHVKAIKTAYDNNLEHIIISEDDLSFKYIDKLKKNISEIIQDAPEDWNVIKLHSSNVFSIADIIQNDQKNIPFIDWNPNYMSGGFYLLNRNGMKAILDHFFINDHYTIRNEKSLAADVIIFRHIPNVYLYTKMFVINNNFFHGIESEINASNWRKKLELDGILLTSAYIDNLQHDDHDYECDPTSNFIPENSHNIPLFSVGSPPQQQPSSSNNSSELNNEDIELVMNQTNVSRQDAINSLQNNNGDIIAAIISLT